jgi:hypothetical protein
MQARFQSDLQGLILDAELAGTAMACRWSSSDEFEAALIAARRRAGAYGAPLHRRFAVLAVIVLAAVSIALVL